ncbi:potassium/proton antiporter regulatory subunit, CPA2 family [Pseudonocardia ammonioxydans]|uniref:Potassium/proton antiporter regulatory subunit, CPA2 family n=1 Tax=Pseudonocardia ammonioxydans TaxID=260086 RepID=A0A1I5FEH8_PSUAM|nr:potassium/proton antiporter regulatory subunit, CPA2 family [Pseudonocardia ammonioxydans]
MRKEIELRDGRRIGVISHRDGRTALILSRADDPDACVAELPLTNEEAGALANLLGAPQLVNQLNDEHKDLPGITTRRLPVKSHSPYDGRPLGDSALRTRTQVSVVAVMRAGQVHPSPTPDFVLAGGDVLIAVGLNEKLDQAADVLARG